MKYLVFVFASVFIFSAQAESSGRDWSVNPISIFSIILGDTYKPDTGSSETRTGQTLSVEFGRNMGAFEVGPILSYSYFKDDSDKDTTTLFGGYFRFNFVENAPGTMLVPFARVSYVFGDYKNEPNVGSSTTTKANILRLRAGATWFPVNDYVAIEGFAEYSDRQYKIDTGDYKYDGTTLNGAFAVYF